MSERTVKVNRRVKQRFSGCSGRKMKEEHLKKYMVEDTKLEAEMKFPEKCRHVFDMSFRFLHIFCLVLLSDPSLRRGVLWPYVLMSKFSAREKIPFCNSFFSSFFSSAFISIFFILSWKSCQFFNLVHNLNFACILF